MALKRPADTADSAPFETVEGDEEVVGQTYEAEAPATSTAVTAAATTGLVPAIAGLGPTTCVLQQRKDFFLKTMGDRLDWRAATGVTVKSGAIFAGDTNIGDTLDFVPLNWEDLWCATPATGQANAESAALLRWSVDGVNIRNNGGLLTDYVEELKEQGFTNAKIEKRGIIEGQFVDSKKGKEELAGKLVRISLSPSSLGAWVGMIQQRNVQIMLSGKPETSVTNTVRAAAKVISSKGNTFSVFEFSVLS